MREREFQYNEPHPSPPKEGDVSLIFTIIDVRDEKSASLRNGLGIDPYWKGISAVKWILRSSGGLVP